MIILMTSLKIVKLSRVRWEGRHNNDNHDHDHEDNYDHDDDHDHDHDHDDHDHDLIRNGEVDKGEVGKRHGNDYHDNDRDHDHEDGDVDVDEEDDDVVVGEEDDDHDDTDLIRNGEVVEGEVGRRHCWFSFSSLW